MQIAPTWQKASDLTEQALQVASGLNLPRGGRWLTTVTVFLTQANELLAVIRLLLDKNLSHRAVILARSLFELAVNLVYIDREQEPRLTVYLQHGGIPTTIEEATQLKEKLEAGDSAEGVEVIPNRGWKPLKHMCYELGSGWVQEYGSFYRYASVPTHAGSFSLGQNYQRLLNQELPADHERSSVLLSGLVFHLRLALIAANAFPKQMSAKAISELQVECGRLTKELASS